MQRIKTLSILLFISIILVSCQFFTERDDRIPVAKVNNTYLYQEDIKGVMPENITATDSLLFVQNFITKWATEQLFFDGALLNLSNEKQSAFNKLIKQYKNDLYTNAYIEELVKRSVDTVVNIEEAKQYYNNNKEAFKLNEELIKFRYIHVDKNIIDFDELKEKFKRYSIIDRKEIDSMSIQFKSYSLNDSIWIKFKQVADKIPAITAKNKKELLKKSNFIQLKDSLGVYLMQINRVLLRNDTAPLEYIKPTIDQIVINKRKLELSRELEKDITKDAIKNKQFEIYN